MAGMLAARVLADTFEQVTIIERPALNREIRPVVRYCEPTQPISSCSKRSAGGRITSPKAQRGCSASGQEAPDERLRQVSVSCHASACCRP